MVGYDMLKYYIFTAFIFGGMVPAVLLIAIRKDENEDRLRTREIIGGLIPVLIVITLNLYFLDQLGFNGHQQILFYMLLFHAAFIYGTSQNFPVYHPLPEYTSMNLMIIISIIGIFALIITMGLMSSTRYYESQGLKRMWIIKDYIQKISTIYDKISFNTISTRMRLPIQETISIVERLIYLNGIHGVISGNYLILSNHFRNKSNLQVCILCNKSIDDDDGVFCPFCDVYAHKSEFLEWLKIKACCPRCQNQINLEKFRSFMKDHGSSDLDMKNSEPCPICKKMIPVDSFYCIFCGVELKELFIKK